MTETELGYVAEGYTLPDGWTWEIVHAHRARYDIEPIFVPLSTVAGFCAWGVPFKGDHPMKH